MTLEPIDPETALEMYLADRANELADASLKSHEYRLIHFVRWCNQEDLENLNTLSGRKLHEFRLWRREDGDLNKVSEKTQMDTVRAFIRWLESVDGVEQDLSQKVLSPTITPQENSRTVMLEAERIEEILAYLEAFEYASIEHVLLSLLWHTMTRTGSVHALDVEDYYSDEQYLELRHRPDTGTPIKNKEDGERLIALSEELCRLIDDWLDHKWPGTTDCHGRNPLLSTRHGRLQKSTVRSYVYQVTRPCAYGEECPHDRDSTDCDALPPDSASKCPSSVSPHAIRRGSITHGLTNDVPEAVVSDRANVSPAVIEQHYDQRTERERMEQRREYLGNL